MPASPVTLEDKYTLASGRAYITGTPALPHSGSALWHWTADQSNYPHVQMVTWTDANAASYSDATATHVGLHQYFRICW